MDNLDNVASSDSNNKDIKLKVTSADVIVRMIADKPYYEIKYCEIGCSEYHIGYGSHELKYVFEWLKECFEIVNTDERAYPQLSEMVPNI